MKIAGQSILLFRYIFFVNVLFQVEIFFSQRFGTSFVVLLLSEQGCPKHWNRLRLIGAGAYGQVSRLRSNLSVVAVVISCCLSFFFAERLVLKSRCERATALPFIETDNLVN